MKKKLLLLLLIPGFSFASTAHGVSSEVKGDFPIANGVSPTGHKGAHSSEKYGIPIKGKVTDPASGNGLAGVSIKVKGSDIGTVTDAAGNFSLQADEHSTLLFTYVGYETVEMAVNGKTDLSIRMQQSSKSLNDVIVVGYGTQRKSLTTAAVSTIATKDIAQKPVVNLTNSLVGRASGLIITQGSGEPGFDGSNILIRGIGSFNRSTPLFVVDGVPRDFSRLDPNTIETISVLKDAAAVAPYGIAGANGVILITTKQGKSGKPSLSYTGYFGIQNPTKVPQMVNSYEYALMRNEAVTNDGFTPQFTDLDIQKFKDHSDPDGHSDGQPLKEIINRNTHISSNNVALSGGNDDIKYYASLGYTAQDGMWSTTSLKKYNGILNITAKATKSTTVGLSVNSYVEDGHYPSQGAGTIINQAQRQTPNFPVYYSNGLWAGYVGQSLIGEIYHSGYETHENTALYTQLTIDQKLPVKGLSLKAVISYDNGPDPLFGNQTSMQRKYTTPIPLWNVDTTTKPYTYNKGNQGTNKPIFQETSTQNHDFTYQGFVNYTGSFGKSDITALAVVEERIVKYQTFNIQRNNYNLNIDEIDYGGPAPTDLLGGGSSSGQKQLGYVYRVDYAYDKKYLFQVAGRYDGSYLFAPGHRFGFFPAFSAGWRISEEKFMKDITWVNYLKLRGSWGTSGAYPSKDQNIQTYQYLDQYGVYANSAVIGGTSTQGISENLQGNPNLTWERAKKTDIGFEATLWNGLLGIEADYFYEKRNDMLVAPTGALPLEYGVALGPVNAGIMTNHGVDFTLTTFKNFSHDLRLDIRGTFTFARNKLIQTFEAPGTASSATRHRTGRPYNTQFGYQAIGLFTDADFVSGSTLKPGIPNQTFGAVHPGDIRYADVSGPNGKPDGIIDGNDETVIGKPNTPEIIYGLEPRLTYKNFDLDILLQGSGNSNIVINNYFAFPFLGSGSATELSFKEHWTPTHQNAIYPRLHGTPIDNNTKSSSWWVRNDSYIRVKSVEIGYSLGTKAIGHAVQNLRIFVAGQNLVNWLPKVKETIDPENSPGNQNYYQQRVVSFGLNATF